MIESWMVSFLGMAVTFIGMLAVLRHRTNEHGDKLDNIFNRLDRYSDDIVELKTKSKLSMTGKDVDDKYVSKELFRQFEKHIDARFDKLESGQGKILAFIERTATKDR